MSSLDIAQAPEVAAGSTTPCNRSLHRLRASFRWAAIYTAGDWTSGNQAFAISRGSAASSPHTPGHERRFNGMLFSPFSFESGSTIGPRDDTSNPSPLRGGYVRAPRGAEWRAISPSMRAPGVFAGQVVTDPGAGVDSRGNGHRVPPLVVGSQLALEVDAVAVACGGWSPSAHRLTHHSLGLN